MRRKIVFTLHIWQEEGVWIGECVELETIAVTDENTKESVLDALKEQVVLTVKTFAATGILSEALAKRDVTVIDVEDQPQHWVASTLSKTVEPRPQSQLGILEWFGMPDSATTAAYGLA